MSRRKALAEGSASKQVSDGASAYQPTEKEAAALAAYEAARETRSPLPCLRLKDTGKDPHGRRSFAVSVDHEHPRTGYQLLSHALGIPPAMLAGIIDSLAVMSVDHASPHETNLNFAVSFVATMKPTDPLECALATQMAMIHLALVRVTTKFALASTTDSADMNERAMNRLARTFAAQVEALKRHRSKGEQRVYVERVNVEPGGQAVVGNVNSGREGHR